MSKECSFDIVSEFDFQELRNAVDQVNKELKNRYDFKDSKFEVNLSEDKITVKVEDDMKLSAIRETLIKRVVTRKLDPKILQFQTPESALGGTLKQDVTLVKALDTETAKKIAKIVRDEFKKTAKATIQGDSVRISSKNKDDLQKIIQYFKKQEDIEIPLVFNNYR